FGISSRADNTSGSDSSERTDFFRHRNHRANLGDRYIELFDFLADRCTAASAGSSGGSQNHSRYTSGFQLTRDFFADSRRVFDRGMGAARRVYEFVEFTDCSFAFEIAHRVQRYQAIWITISDSRIVAGMDRVIFVGIERCHADDWNRGKAR